MRAFHREPLHWHGIVSVFQLIGHPRAATAYAWRSTHGIAVMLAIPPVATAADAVREWLMTAT